MGTRKGISSLLSSVKKNPDDQQRRSTTFEKLMQISPFDSEPNISEIAQQVSEKSVSKSVSKGQTKGQTSGQRSVSKGQTKGQTSGQRNGLTKNVSKTSDEANDFSPSSEYPKKGFFYFRAPGEPRTKSEKILWKYLEKHKNIVINYDDLSEETRIPKTTIRNILRRWSEQNILIKTKAPGNTGLKIEFTPNRQTNGHTLGVSILPSKIDREDLNLSISPETLQTAWPNLARKGFGLEQISQIEKTLTEQGKVLTRVVQGLDHAEWELENEKMVDKSDQPVADPCSWVFRSLARDGYYRRPKGYISPQEQAEKDLEAEAKAVLAARQAAEIKQFEVWKLELSEKDLEEAMKGHPGGPKDAWLRKIWMERNKK